MRLAGISVAMALMSGQAAAHQAVWTVSAPPRGAELIIQTAESEARGPLGTVTLACDAARYAKKAYVSVRRGYHFIPKHIFGKPADVFAHDGPKLPKWLELALFTWLQRIVVGDTTALGMPKPDHRVLESHPLMNDQLLHHLRHGDVTLKPDIEAFAGKSVRFKDGSPRVPLGAIKGQRLTLLLQDLTRPVADVHDFDRLPDALGAGTTQA